jgi:hypothetical protein
VLRACSEDALKDRGLGGFVGHALRHLYATLALEAGVPIAELKFLLNNAVSSGGVTMGYLHPSLEHLRGWQEKATARVLSAISIVCGSGCISRPLVQISPDMLTAR